MANTVIGIFDNSSEAQRAVEQLVSNGFTRSDIDVSSRGDDLNRTSTGTTSGYSSDRRDDDSFGDKVSSFFSSLFDSDDDARTYSSVGSKGCVVTVHAQSMQEAERAADILDRYGAVDVNEKASQFGSTASSTTDYTEARSTTDTTTGAIPVIEEELQVGKRIVETGGVRLRSRIVERPVEEHLRLRTEHVHVERNAVNRPATEADLNTFKEGTIEVREQAEVPVVGKTARVVEEVRLEKDVEERDETIRETLRGTDVDVENLSSTDRDRFTTDRDQFSTDRDRFNNDSRYDDDSSLNRPGAL